MYTLHLGNCVDVMKSLDTCIADLTVTSPPYDNLREYKGYSFDFEAVAKQLWWITKPGGVVVWVVADATINGSETGTSFKQALFFKSLGFNLHDTMIWSKPDYIPKTHPRYEQQFEYMFVFSKGKPKTFSPIMVPSQKAGQTRNREKSNKEFGSAVRSRNEVTTINPTKIKGNVWQVSPAKNNLDHPAQFPEQLALDHILSWSNTGDTVFDPFTGSGTTGKMAVLNNRNFIGIEIAKDYYDIAEKRISEATLAAV